MQLEGKNACGMVYLDFYLIIIMIYYIIINYKLFQKNTNKK